MAEDFDPQTDERDYMSLMHAMQTGVALKLAEEWRGEVDEAKHLRVGVNSALCDHAAIVRLLIDKGLISEEEYREALRVEMAREVARYEDDLNMPRGSLA